MGSWNGSKAQEPQLRRERAEFPAWSCSETQSHCPHGQTWGHRAGGRVGTKGARDRFSSGKKRTSISIASFQGGG